jgi:hypothetical protein
MQSGQTSGSRVGQTIALLSHLLAVLAAPAAADSQQAGVPLTSKGRFQLETAAKPKAAQAQALQRCLAAARPSGAGNLSVTFQQDVQGYRLLQTRNAQLRGSRIMPLAFVQPASSADVSAAVRCSVEAGLRFVARNGEQTAVMGWLQDWYCSSRCSPWRLCSPSISEGFGLAVGQLRQDKGAVYPADRSPVPHSGTTSYCCVCCMVVCRWPQL